jgi:3-deoxy-manno-octulosonate cytidylyltransferase (CMP-KDO synthetase)
LARLNPLETPISIQIDSKFSESDLHSCGIMGVLFESNKMKTRLKILGVIPARYDSQRLPGKVLLNIGEKAMVHWVYERARQSPFLSKLFVATDSKKVLDYCSDHDIPAIMTAQHSSGSDRLYEVMEQTDGDIYLNLQGDEPTVRPEHIESLLRPILAGQAEVTTLRVLMDPVAAKDINCVKVVTDNRERALYFSRLPIPFNRSPSGAIKFYKHIGLYGYTRKALAQFHKLPQSSLELSEKLEQLRLLENGIDILVPETPYDTVGVDTEADLKDAADFLLGSHAGLRE